MTIVFIYFVGLASLVTNLTEPRHILIPHFPQFVKPENNVITVPHDLVVTGQTDWPILWSSGGLDAFAIGTQNIHISGTGTFSATDVVLPHLTCCCSNTKKGLKGDYNDPDAEPSSKKAAYVYLDNG